MTKLLVIIAVLLLGDSVETAAPETPEPQDRVRMGRTSHGRQRTYGGTQGHALDASLQFGSGGYNRPVSSRGFSRGLYGAGSSRSIYRVGRDGNMVWDANAAFGSPKMYSPTGGHSGARGRRFRYSRGRY